MSFNNLELPTLQAVGSTTFSVPQDYLHGKMTLPEVWDHHAAHSAEHPLFVYEDAPGDPKTITWAQAVRAMHRAGHIIKSFADSHSINNQGGKPPVIGVLAVKDSPTGWAVITAIIRLGFTVFLISPRNSTTAVVHLIKETGADMVIASADSGVQTLLKESLHELGADAKPVMDFPSLEDLYQPSDASFTSLPKIIPGEYNMESPALISHSSGSTSFPKPRTLTHKQLVQWSYSMYYGTIDVCRKRMATNSLPLFHIMGFLTMIIFPTGAGFTCCIFKPQNPPVIPTAEVTLADALASKANWILCVPSHVEEWSRDESLLPQLRKFETISFAGGPLQKKVGDYLVQNGVNVHSIYGATEFGSISPWVPGPPSKDWEYIRLTAQPGVQWKPSGDNLYELILTETAGLKPSVYNAKYEDRDAYATNDLFEKHPLDDNLWKVYGRADDQIMHSTGEKTNPGPMEEIIKRHPAVRYALMFGRSQFQTGIIIHPSDPSKVLPRDEASLSAFRNEIWPAVEEANAFAPKHSRIFKEMIILSNPEKPFQLTPKQTLKRNATTQLYQDEIAAAYQAVEDSSLKDIQAPATWSTQETTDFVRKLIHRVLSAALGDDDDIFQSGADSLQATSIRNSLVHALRQSKIDTSHISQNLVYSSPTINALAKFVTHLAGGGPAKGQSYEEIAQEMQALVDEYTAKFPAHTGTKPVPTEEAILVTGTTGSLGSLIIGRLASLPSVGRVYALNRGSRAGTTLRQRQAHTLQEHGVDPAILDGGKIVLLEGDAGSPQLGLSTEAYEEIRDSITTIIHNAWRVDFNLALSSYKPLIRGTRSLVDLSLASPFAKPPRIVFTSSISSVHSWPGPGDVPERSVSDAHVGLGNGYGESKWVSERILDVAAENTPLEPVVVRVGQLCGSTINGHWNPWEWFPAIIRSSKALGCLPDSEGTVSWTPIDVAANAVVDFRHSHSRFVHLIHPKPVTWSALMHAISEIVQIQTVSYSDWLSKLKAALEAPHATQRAATDIPALRIAEFYEASGQSHAKADGEAFGLQPLASVEAKKASPTLNDPDLSSLGAIDVQKWLGYWKSFDGVKA